MKNLTLLFVTLLISNLVYCQIIESGGGEFKLNPDPTNCISEKQRNSIKNEISLNRTLLERNGLLKKLIQTQTPLLHPMFIWPVVKNPASPFTSVWGISGHVDHNLSFPNALQDWNCGTRTYDTAGGYNHKGIDISTWPFSWFQFQNNHSWVVAAAPGIIINKSDGNFDMNCSFNNSNWNAIYIQHSDGSVAWYGHLKSGTLSSKNIGQSVLAGEFLGVIGSSGNSTGPHLHFEVYNSNNQLVDPYQGTCNNWSSSVDSWWLNQKPYFDPKINAVLTHSQVFNFNNCPQTESVFLNNNFANGSPVVISIYLADQMPNTTGNIQIINPNNTIVSNFNFNLNSFFTASYWYWTYNSSFFTSSGQWKIRFTYLGNTVEHLFNYGTLSKDEFDIGSINFYPNPSDNFITIENKNKIVLTEISIIDLSGKVVLTEKNNFDVINTSTLSTGIYFIKFISENKTFKTKLIKK